MNKNPFCYSEYYMFLLLCPPKCTVQNVGYHPPKFVAIHSRMQSFTVEALAVFLAVFDLQFGLQLNCHLTYEM